MSNGDFQAAYERVKGFFAGEISQYLIADLQRMAGIQDAPHLTIPESLAVFSALDFLGFLMRPDFKDEGDVDFSAALQGQKSGEEIAEADANAVKRITQEASRTSENLRYMCEVWLSASTPEYADPLNLALLTILFRHGGVHQFFPKIGEIGKMPPKQQQQVIRIRTADGEYPHTILEQNQFRQHFLDAVGRIIGIIVDCNKKAFRDITGESLTDMIPRINARLDARLFLDRQQLLDILAKHAPGLRPFDDGPFVANEHQHSIHATDPAETTTTTGVRHPNDRG